ncbi:MAG: MotA/TolQ/ExbB proton channel family protein [Ruminococcus sp.]|nr:MotA/TolQ/ExbB proton channel family protein [Ruminococcus sp.]
MKDFLSVIFSNFWGYDLIIFIAAIVNCFCLAKLIQSADKLYDKMHLTVYVPDGSSSREEADKDISVLRETDIVNMRNNTGKLYSVFVNITGIFPLLGILGTVVSLLMIIDDSTSVLGNFYGALTSTFWGLVFAIGFKFADGIVSARIEDNEKTVALYLERNYGKTSDNAGMYSAMTHDAVSAAVRSDTEIKGTEKVSSPDVPDVDPSIFDLDDDTVDELIKTIRTGENGHA